MNASVTAIVVTYNTDPQHLSAALDTLVSQCRVVVVDNSTQPSARAAIRTTCAMRGADCLTLLGNFGIAHAQNRGICLARHHGATDILLMDDDSVPAATLVRDLLNARTRCTVQPVVISARTIDAQGVDMSNRRPSLRNDLMPCSELTSSGTLIPMSAFDRVGNFDDALFIDCVDFEWGWRALQAGVPLVVCDDVSIRHRLGEGSRLGLRIPSPIRHYYQYRNVSRMIVRSRAPLRWRLSQSVKLPLKLLLIALLADCRIVRLRYAALGLVDSLLGRTGKFNH